MKTSFKTLCFALIVSVTAVCAAPSTGWAMLAPAQGPVATDRAADMKTVQTALESKIVRGRLKALGLNEAETNSRLSKLSDQQVHRLAKDIDTLSPGGDLGGILIIVLLVVLIVYLIHRI